MTRVALNTEDPVAQGSPRPPESRYIPHRSPSFGIYLTSSDSLHLSMVLGGLSQCSRNFIIAEPYIPR